MSEMGFARRAGDGLTVGASGRLTLMQLDHWTDTVPGWPPSTIPMSLPWFGSAAYVGTAWADAAYVSGLSTESLVLRTHLSDPTLGLDSDDTTVGTGVLTNMGGGQWQWVRQVDSASAYVDWSATFGPLYVYAMEGYGLQKLVNPSLTSPTHPNHGWIADAWGTRGANANSDTYSKTVSIGPSALSASNYTMQAAIDLDANGVPIAGSGTTDPWPTLSIGLGLSAKPDKACSGKVAEWTDLQWDTGSGAVAADFSGFSYAADGIEITGGDGTMELSITDYASIPSGGAGSSASEWMPTIVDYGLACFDWNVAYPGARFLIPDNYGGTVSVAAPYTETVVYRKNSWASPALVRPFVVEINLDPDWMEEAGE